MTGRPPDREEYGGQLPADYDKLLSLKGIGMYTAGAIGSIAFELQVPAVDGNVLRVLTRLWGDDSDILKDKTKKAMGRRVMEFMPEDRDRKSTRLNSSHVSESRMPSSA